MKVYFHFDQDKKFIRFFFPLVTARFKSVPLKDQNKVGHVYKEIMRYIYLRKR